MQLLDSRGLAVDLLKAIIEKEVTETEHEATLFRGNSSATRLLTAFARSRGYGYTRFLVTSLLSTLSAQPLGLADLDMYSDASADDDSLVKLEVGLNAARNCAVSGILTILVPHRLWPKPSLASFQTPGNTFHEKCENSAATCT